MLLATVFALLVVSAVSTDPIYTEKYYSRERGPTTEPSPMREFLGIPRRDIVQKREGEEGGYELHEDVTNLFEKYVIPEFCYLTSENLTIYNSFLLDQQCLEAMESVSPKCRGFKCEVTHYFLNNGARIVADFYDAQSYEDSLGVIHKELSAAFKELKMCTCGLEFFKAVFKCAPFYHSNAISNVVHVYGKVARNVDLKSFSKFFDRVMGGLCAETRQGMCLDSIFDGFDELLDMLLTTFEDYEAYEDGDRKFQKSQEKRCDALFGPMQAWIKDDRDLDSDDGEYFWELLFNKTSAVTNEFYCDKRCRKTRGAMYPCCLRRWMEDQKMFDNAARVIESIYHLIPATSYDFQWEGFYELDSYFRREYPDEELQRILAWTIPDQIREDFMRTVHGAKYCGGKTVKCSK